MYKTLTKMYVEDIFPWIRFASLEISKNPESVIKTFQKCGYINVESQNTNNMETEEISNFMSNKYEDGNRRRTK